MLDGFVGEVGLFSLDGSVGFGEAEGEWRPLTGAFTGEMCPFLNGELDTIFKGERSEGSIKLSIIKLYHPVSNSDFYACLCFFYSKLNLRMDGALNGRTNSLVTGCGEVLSTVRC